ncbi:putative molybdenum carrier protein [Crocinitomicaceae bacterium]|nr:putative molybdenum carrier protein [Crocinitomicaceae bacterium]
MKIFKIISGGQTGADKGGLIAAKKANIKTGGIAPKGFMTEAGKDPSLKSEYGLRENFSDDLKERTLSNLRGAHCTIVFATKPGSRGTKFTIDSLEREKRMYIVLNPFESDAPEKFREFFDLVYERYKNPLIVNIAGNRESRSKGIEEKVMDLLSKCL